MAAAAADSEVPRTAWITSRCRCQDRAKAMVSNDSRPSAGTGGRPQPTTNERTNIMKALVYHGPGKRAWEEVPDAVIQESTDAVVRVDAVTICGTDLHILGGDVPEVVDGRILGHEAVGTVLEVGAAVTGIAEGSRVLISCITG